MIVRVTWRNARSSYLQSPSVTIAPAAGSGATVATRATPAGTFEFDVNGAVGDQVDVALSFSPTFRGITHTVYDLRETLSISGANTLAFAGADRGLAAIKNPRQNPGGFVEIEAQTDFVDLDDFWFDPSDTFWNERADVAAKKEADWTLHALGCTSGATKLWLAVVLDASRDITAVADETLGAFVYYRHENYSYSDFDKLLDEHGAVVPNALHTGIARTILSLPVPASPPDPDAPDGSAVSKYFFTAFPQTNLSATRFDQVSLGLHGFGRSLLNSRCHAVMLIPWPSNIDYSPCAGGDMPRVVEAALKLLHQRRHVARSQARVKLGRLALGAFSFSGQPVSSAVASTARVDEVYWFDADYGMAGQNQLLAWANAGSSNKRLRLNTGGILGTGNRNVASQVREPQRVVLYPPNADATFWDPAGTNLWYDRMIERAEKHNTRPPGASTESMRTIVKAKENDISARHHFCVQGGEGDFSTANGFGRYWLEQFLVDSGFARISAAAPLKAEAFRPEFPKWPTDFLDEVRGGFILEHPDAPASVEPARAYFFKGVRENGKLVGKYIALTQSNKTFIDTGFFPALVSAKWPNWPKAWGDAPIDAAMCTRHSGADHKVYFFKGAEYITYDPATNAVDGGPFPINSKRGVFEDWKVPAPFDGGIDAAITWDESLATFFRKDQWLDYDLTNDRVLNGPSTINRDFKNWPASFAHGISAAIRWGFGSGTAYFLRGNQFIAYTKGVGVDAGHPRTLVPPR